MVNETFRSSPGQSVPNDFIPASIWTTSPRKWAIAPGDRSIADRRPDPQPYDEAQAEQQCRRQTSDRLYESALS